MHSGSHTTSDLGRWVAVLTAILASIGALLSYGITTSQNHAILVKNEAVIALVRAARIDATHRRSVTRRRVVRQLDVRAAALNRQSARLMSPHDHFAQALVLVEIGVALASVAALTDRRWLLYMALSTTAGALVLAVIGLSAGHA
ncbi:MAG: DUF4337 family protein [Acidiferrobacter sp.]